MSVQMNHRHYRSLRASLRTACVALIATGATACIFIDDINVSLDPPLPGQPPATHDTDEPCDTTRGEEPPPPPSDESSCSTDGDSGSGSGGGAHETGAPPTTGETPMDTDTDAQTTTDATTGEFPPQLCGNGELDAGEACDDGINDGSYNGCMSGCTQKGPVCGDGALHDSFESCDDGNLIEDDGCPSSCQLPGCGDGVVQPNEQCDGSLVMDVTCESLGFGGGTLTCTPDTCLLDTVFCFVCGNGVLEGDETCDGGAMGDATCESLGFTGGTLTCNDKCSAIDTANCI